MVLVCGVFSGSVFRRGSRTVKVSLLFVFPRHVSVAWSGGKEGAARDVAGERAARKRRKYGRAAVIAGADSVVPFVVEANGAIGEDADRRLNTIGGVAHDYSREATHSFRHRAADVMAIAVQRGHAELVARALSFIGYPAPQR